MPFPGFPILGTLGHCQQINKGQTFSHADAQTRAVMYSPGQLVHFHRPEKAHISTYTYMPYITVCFSVPSFFWVCGDSPGAIAQDVDESVILSG